MYLLVNFGGPRNLDEIGSFLQELLCDQDVIRTPFPLFLHNWFFSRVAKKRSLKIKEDYELIGGKSPIYFDTEALAKALSIKLNAPVLTFHRYLRETHAASLERIKKAKDLTVIPLFPQFSFATTGSIARFFSKHFTQELKWIKSYPSHPAFIAAYQKRIATFLKEKNLKEEESVFLFSAHGLPKKFVEEGDPYEKECQSSYQALLSLFPKAIGKLCYQSKFGRGEWLRPYTNEAAAAISTWNQGRKNVIFIPLSFTSDHIETLFEVEKLYLPLIGEGAYRCPALNLEPYWIDALAQIAKEPNLICNSCLIRK
jgi:ferrochelatase